jgi:hypothetical protein
MGMENVGAIKRRTPAWRFLCASAAAFAFWAAGCFPVRSAELNDYPTAARADYVFGCMKVNGDSRIAMEQCSCSIDVVASILPYERYVTAETAMSLSQVPGQLGAMFMSAQPTKTAVDELRRAQSEAEIRCF